jgi:RNA polymerase sigma-70 factor (ECF subfamily)
VVRQNTAIVTRNHSSALTLCDGILFRMHTTSVTLLERLRQPTDQQAWQRFVVLYTPLLFYWARRMGLAQDEAADLVQEVLTLLVQKLPDFHYDRQKNFRNWLHTITVNKWREGRRRAGGALLQADDNALQRVPDPRAADLFEETEYRRHLVAQALQLMQREFEPATWQACWEVVVAGKAAGIVAAELGISRDAVYAAKSRVLRRLRQELAGLLD